MFTGIVEGTGRVSALRLREGGAELVVDARGIAAGAGPGDSIAVNGVCLTLTRLQSAELCFDLSGETLEGTTLGRARAGMCVNLERALLPTTRMGGHFVLGHVDGIGKLLRCEPGGGGWLLTIGYPSELGRFLVYKGSVAVDGVSLTVASLADSHFCVAVIPFTWDSTNLNTSRPGSAVNLETDILGKYVERMLAPAAAQASGSGMTTQYLKEQGF